MLKIIKMINLENDFYDFWMLSTKHLLVCFKKCYFHAIYPLGFQTLFNRGDLDRPTSQCCSTHVTDFEDFGSGELRPKPSPSDLKNTLFFRAPILKGKSHSITFPNRQRMQKINVFGKISYATDSSRKTVQSRKPVRSLKIK